MTVHFYDDAHEAFFREKLERAAASGRTPDNYFRSFLYLCGLCPDTRSHFHRLFDWREWCICPEALAAFLPDEIFCCGFQSCFFEAVRLRFPEYADAASSLPCMGPG